MSGGVEVPFEGQAAVLRSLLKCKVWVEVQVEVSFNISRRLHALKTSFCYFEGPGA